MSMTAHALGEALWPATLDLGRTKTVRLAGVLEALEGLQEITVIGDSRGLASAASAASVRAFRVRSGSERLGLQPGDCLLAHAKPQPEVGDLVVVDFGGVVTAHRVTHRHGTRLQFDPSLPKHSVGAELHVVGAFAGILRKRLVAQRAALPTLTRGDRMPVPSRSAGTVRLLRGRLGMVESTCAATTNPRLRRALRNEAENLRRLLQNEAGDH